MVSADLKHLNRTTASDKILCDEEFNIAKYPKYDGYQRGLTSMVYKIFWLKTSGGAINNENISNKKLTKKLHRPIIRTFQKQKIQSSFINNIWGGCWYC